MTEARSILYCPCRRLWREWLAANYDAAGEVWLVFPVKAVGEESINYNDAVEEALCFGWIDGVAGTLDETHKLRRFTPRRKGSPYSRPNIERLIWLDAQGMILPAVRESVAGLISTPYRFPKDILAELRRDKTVWRNYQSFSEPYKRIRVAYIDAARKRPDEFARRLAHFIRNTRQNKMIVGYGGVEKYYSAGNSMADAGE